MTKKSFFMFAVVACLAMVFASCNKDDVDFNTASTPVVYNYMTADNEGADHVTCYLCGQPLYYGAVNAHRHSYTPENPCIFPFCPFAGQRHVHVVSYDNNSNTYTDNARPHLGGGSFN